jgi:two-component system sensor histidine kinase MprB
VTTSRPRDREGRRSWWRRLSLRGRLTVIAAAAVAVAVIAVSSTSWLVIRATLYRGFDAQVRSYAQLAVTAPDPETALRLLTAVQLDDGNRETPSGLLAVQFLARDGTRTTTAGRVGDLPVTPAARAVATGSAGAAMETVSAAGRQLRMFTLPRPGGAVQVARGMDGLEDTLSKIALVTALVAVAGVATAALLGWGVARTALRPVDALTAAVQRVASTGDFSGSVPVEGSGEIANLASAFNRMLSALAAARRAQRRLIEDASHELRTPLASLRHNVEFLLHAGRATRSTPLRFEDQVELLEDIDCQTIELTALIDELVEMAKEEAAPEPLDRVDLAAVVRAALDRVRPNAPGIGFRVATEQAVVVGRPQSLERAASNLLYNAAKWSPPGGVVDATVTVRAGEGVITVADEGPGIAEADIPHVFERFYRAAGARALPGSGLGLAIVAQIVDSHGGSVAAARSATGGALLTISLPLAERSRP